MVYTKQQIINELRDRGYKLTPQRRRIVEAITGVQEHLTPAEIHKVVSRDDPTIGLVTIYRTLEILAELELVCEVHVGGNCRSYLLRRPREHHHHLVCSRCGTVVDFTDCDLSRLEDRISKDNGFTIEGHILEFIGRCRECNKLVENRNAR
jgi:Fur family ferric uptake transcriptional regulator